jgi:hypothetical protein
MFLPSYKATKLSFLKKILSGEKAVMKTHEVKRLTIPPYSELAVKALLPKFI